jgi:hypothetical protein
MAAKARVKVELVDKLREYKGVRFWCRHWRNSGMPCGDFAQSTAEMVSDMLFAAEEAVAE